MLPAGCVCCRSVLAARLLVCPAMSAATSAKTDKVRLIGVGGVRSVSESSFDFLHTEMVHYLAQQIAKQDKQSHNQPTMRLTHTGHSTDRTSLSSPTPTDRPAAAAAAVLCLVSLAFDVQCVVLYGKLEGLGYSVGHRLSERYTKDVNWLSSELDMIKFVCKEFWLAVWKRQVDKLQTNYRGVYVLHDSGFRLLQHIRAVHPAAAAATTTVAAAAAATAHTASHEVDKGEREKEREREQLDEQARVYVAFSCGVLRGALMNLGVTATVRADIVRGTGVSFTISDVERINRAEHQQQQQQQQPQQSDGSRASSSGGSSEG